MKGAAVEEKKLFDDKQINKVRSPEQLGNYISVANPSIWVALAAIIVIMIGVLGWVIFGKIPLVVDTVAIADNQQIVCLVKAEDYQDLAVGQTALIGEESFEIASIPQSSICVDESINEYARSVGDLSIGEFVFPVTLSGTYPSGIYSAQITTGYLSPITMILN